MTGTELDDGVIGLPSVLLSSGHPFVVVAEESVSLQDFELETPLLQGGVPGPPVVEKPYVVTDDGMPLEGPVTGFPSVLLELLSLIDVKIIVDGSITVTRLVDVRVMVGLVVGVLGLPVVSVNVERRVSGTVTTILVVEFAARVELELGGFGLPSVLLSEVLLEGGTECVYDGEDVPDEGVTGPPVDPRADEEEDTDPVGGADVVAFGKYTDEEAGTDSMWLEEGTRGPPVVALPGTETVDEGSGVSVVSIGGYGRELTLALEEGSNGPPVVLLPANDEVGGGIIVGFHDTELPLADVVTEILKPELVLSWGNT
ncbi:hypothetical protein H2201_003869 [Coniosporium apollinis]|uniref:Uncharacterized protein n=1 Tax=Coniosporium apollinis TaxID=61459 RepID=A0ABQ9NW41_9PEZI|nr:hypothetical protein H2201_003869 [Coniosporium apollinis]